jgi:DNA-binding GntR family transcriptional regulator
VIRTKTLASQLYDELLRMIVTGELPTGSPLQEVDLAERFGVSRTPVREALRRLSEYGVVETRPNYSAVVRRMGRDEMVHIQQVREALEGMAASLACNKLTAADIHHLDALAAAAQDKDSPDRSTAEEKLDDALHSLIAARTGNPVLAREIRKLIHLNFLVYLQLERKLLDSRNPVAAESMSQTRKLALREHIAIIAALKSGNPELCRKAMVDHVRRASERTISMKEDELLASRGDHDEP